MFLITCLTSLVFLFPWVNNEIDLRTFSYKFQYGSNTEEAIPGTEDCPRVHFGDRSLQMLVPPIAEGPSTPEPNVRRSTLVIKQPDGDFGQEEVTIKEFRVSDGGRRVSVLEPGGDGGCSAGIRTTVKDTADLENCEVAVNAGFFNSTSGKCYGNLIHNGKIIETNRGIQAAHFGVFNNNSLFFGYLGEGDATLGDWRELVGGVIWVVKNGSNAVNESINTECENVEETGTLEIFSGVRSGRTVVGSDEEGRLVIWLLNGRTGERGLSLGDLAEVLIRHGIRNAINFDGGGSSAAVVNGTVVSDATDMHDTSDFRFERKVSTVLCIRRRDASPPERSDNGTCESYGGSCDDLQNCRVDCQKHDARAKFTSSQSKAIRSHYLEYLQLQLRSYERFSQLLVLAFGISVSLNALLVLLVLWRPFIGKTGTELVS